MRMLAALHPPVFITKRGLLGCQVHEQGLSFGSAGMWFVEAGHGHCVPVLGMGKACLFWAGLLPETHWCSLLVLPLERRCHYGVRPVWSEASAQGQASNLHKQSTVCTAAHLRQHCSRKIA
eukprot:833525-Pelagomonas_calceolata.AAC.5